MEKLWAVTLAPKNVASHNKFGAGGVVLSLTPYYERDGLTIYCGDSLEVMPQLEADTVATVLTDPPYGLKFISKDWDHGIPGVSFWCECLRLAIPGAHLLAFGGTRTYHRLAVAIEDANWQIRDCISYMHDGDEAQRAFLESLSADQLEAYLETHYPNSQMEWIYGSGFPKSANVSKMIDRAMGKEREVVGKVVRLGDKKSYDFNISAIFGEGNGSIEAPNITAPSTPLAAEFDGYGSALKPAHEPIVVAMAPMPGSYAHNAEVFGVGGLNVDESRIGIETKDDYGRSPNRKDGTRSSSRGHSWGEGLKEDMGIPSHKGRYPANLIHSGEPAVQGVFDRVGWRPTSSRPNSEGIIYSKNGLVYGKIGEFVHSSPKNDAGGTAARYFYSAKASTKERGVGNTHPTVKPLELFRYLARLTRQPHGGLILDPFLGSGTTLLAARAENRPAIGIDISEEYCAITVSRLRNVSFVSAPKNGKVKAEESQGVLF